MILVYILLGIGLVALFIVGARMMHVIGYECIFCAGRARHLGALEGARRRQVLEYFAHTEDRIPFEETVFVCDDCHRVNDDKIAGNTPLGLSIRCKACGIACNLGDSMTCQTCGVTYEWTTFKQCGDYRFLLPQPSAEAAKQ